MEGACARRRRRQRIEARDEPIKASLAMSPTHLATLTCQCQVLSGARVVVVAGAPEMTSAAAAAAASLKGRQRQTAPNCTTSIGRVPTTSLIICLSGGRCGANGVPLDEKAILHARAQNATKTISAPRAQVSQHTHTRTLITRVSRAHLTCPQVQHSKINTSTPLARTERAP